MESQYDNKEEQNSNEQNENVKNELQNDDKEGSDENGQKRKDSIKEISDGLEKDFEILSSDSAQYDYNYKIIIIGDSGVGKTCITYRATSGEFREKLTATIGFEFLPFVIKYKNKILKLEIWDTCGQEAYRSLIKSFFNNSSLAIIVYAVDNKRSFTSINEWIRQCRSLCSPDTHFFLIGNKSDVDNTMYVLIILILYFNIGGKLLMMKALLLKKIIKLIYLWKHRQKMDSM